MSMWNHNVSFSEGELEGWSEDVLVLVEDVVASVASVASVALVALNRAAQVGPRFAWSAERMEGAMIVCGGDSGDGSDGGVGMVWIWRIYFLFFSFFLSFFYLFIYSLGVCVNGFYDTCDVRGKVIMV